MSTYRYGFNGQEKSDEIKGEGNSYTAQFWEYDPRLGRRWNVDPLASKFPFQSPYCTMDNDPINIIDPTGMVGEPVIDKKNKTIIFKANVYLYGNIDSKKMNQVLAGAKKSFDENVNGKTFKTQYNGEEYTVSFNVKLITISESGAKNLAKNNTSLENNFVRVEDVPRTSFMAVGGNSGVWTTNDIIGKDKNSTTVIHEFFHSLGLDHPTPKTNIDFSNPFQLKFSNYQESPRISVPRGSDIIVRPPAPLLTPVTYRPINANERKVTQADASEAVQNMNKQKARNKIYSSYAN